MATLQVEIESQIGEGVHTSLRKFCESSEAHLAWEAIQSMPDKEWELVCRIVAEEIIKVVNRRLTKRAADGRWTCPNCRTVHAASYKTCVRCGNARR